MLRRDNAVLQVAHDADSGSRDSNIICLWSVSYRNLPSYKLKSLYVSAWVALNTPILYHGALHDQLPVGLLCEDEETRLLGSCS